jgi:hypothetical protein
MLAVIGGRKRKERKGVSSKRGKGSVLDFALEAP